MRAGLLKRVQRCLWRQVAWFAGWSGASGQCGSASGLLRVDRAPRPFFGWGCPQSGQSGPSESECSTVWVLQPPVFSTSAAMGRQGPLADAPELVTSLGGASSDGADASVASLDIAISPIPVVVHASPTKSIHTLLRHLQRLNLRQPSFCFKTCVVV